MSEHDHRNLRFSDVDMCCNRCYDEGRDAVRRLDEQRTLANEWWRKMNYWRGWGQRQASRAGRFKAERDRARTELGRSPSPLLTVPMVLPLIRAYYAMPGNGAGGSLHIVLEDPNYENEHVQWCYEQAMKTGDSAGALLALVLLAMSKTQRRRLGAMSHYPETSA